MPIDNSTLSYTSREYKSILNDLMNTIPLLTKEWTYKEETDPGIVLVKLMAMLGDMLSYNIDKQALEAYPESVTQRKNAYQIYKLLGYKMHWYVSATCNARLSFADNVTSISIPRYSRFYSKDNSIQYTNLKDISVSGNTTKSLDVELIQGIAKTPAQLSIQNNEDADVWYNRYGYNLSASDFIDNKYYLNDINVDENTVCLCDDLGEWILVDDIDLVTDTNEAYYGNRYFDFNVDEYDRPYIRLCSAWNTDNNGPNKFKLFYIITMGSMGSVSEGVLSIKKDDISVYNEASSYGLDPETPADAWNNSRNWVNTKTTLITCNDFTKAAKRIDGVANAIALDWMTDFQDPVESNMETYEVRVYVVPEDYVTEDASGIELNLLTERLTKYIHDNKILHLLAPTIIYDKISYYDWSVEGTVYLRSPVDKVEADSILNNINTLLKLVYSSSNVRFNEEIKYIDVVQNILSSDSRILYVDLNPISYSITSNGTTTSATGNDLSGKNIIEIDYNTEQTGICDYLIDLYTDHPDTLPIKPSSVTIKINSGSFTIYDDGAGQLTSGVVEGENPILSVNGTIDYGKDAEAASRGQLSFQLRYPTYNKLILEYTTNIVNIARYNNYNPGKFCIASESLKRR